MKTTLTVVLEFESDEIPDYSELFDLDKPVELSSVFKDKKAIFRSHNRKFDSIYGEMGYPISRIPREQTIELVMTDWPPAQEALFSSILESGKAPT